MKRLHGKKALITGAARGIGAAIAKEFIKEGARVVISDIDDEFGKKLASELKASYEHLDVCIENEWEEIVKTYQQFDVLVNNAGILGSEYTQESLDPENCSLENWRHVHDVNLVGTFLGCRYGIFAMKKRGGSIINISSRSGVVGVPLLAPYASSKAAIRNHTKTVALYCAEKGYNIRCNSLLPATIITPMWESLLKNKSTKTAIEASIPLKRFGLPQDVALAAVFLASDESSYITGSEILIDGGVLAGSTSSPK